MAPATTAATTSPERVDPLFLQYVPESTNASGPDEVNGCLLTGPNDTLLLGTVDADPALVRRCGSEWGGDGLPYFSNWRQATLTVQQVIGGQPVGSKPTIKMFTEDVFIWGFSALQAGDAALVSVREDRGEYFATYSLPVNTSATEFAAASVGSTPINLPSKVSDLVAEVAQVRQTFATRCNDRIYEGYGRMKVLSDAEFREFVRTPLSDCSCLPPNSSEPIPSTDMGTD